MIYRLFISFVLLITTPGINVMVKGKKYYVVWVGNHPGIYESWAECLLQVKAYPNAKYKSYRTRTEAVKAYSEGYKPEPNKNKPLIIKNRDAIISNSISVDAACSGNPGLMEYRGVDTATGEELFRQGPFRNGTNNIGEFLALIHGLAYLKKWRQDGRVIYTDSKTALAWLRKKKVNTKIDLVKKNPILHKMVIRAEKWLATNSYKSKVIKWNTKGWGEIPADFGRK